jgi:uncharacterized protein
MKKYSLVLIYTLFVLSAFSQSTSKNDRIRELMEETGAGQLGVQLINNVIATYRKDVPSVPAEFWVEFSKEINPNELIELVVPIYAKHFTEKEINQLIQFYRSPIGQKVIEKLPLITQDSHEVGTNWGKQLSNKVLARLKEKGYFSNN